MPTKKQLEEEIKELKNKIDHWQAVAEGEHNDLWFSVFGALSDGGYGPTSTGQLIGCIRDIIEENEKLKNINKMRGGIFPEEVEELEGHYESVCEENEKLKNCSYEEYCVMVGGENKLIKEWVDLKNEVLFNPLRN